MTAPSKTSPKAALEAIVKYDGGKSVIGDNALCPICGKALLFGHIGSCPFPKIKAAIPVAELEHQAVELLEDKSILPMDFVAKKKAILTKLEALK